jgi:Sec-independent protein translocase protein TatA
MQKIRLITNVGKSQISESKEFFHLKKIPVTVDGAVMNGLLYRAEDNAKGMPSINGRVMTLGHPKNDAGEFISASEGEALVNHFSGGSVEKNYHVNGVHYVDAKIKKSVLKAQNNGEWYYNQLASKKPIGVSTGLFSGREMTEGVNNSGAKYFAIATNQKYDHLALLHESEAPAGGKDTFINFNADATEIVVNLDAFIEANEEQGLFSRVKEFVKSFNSSSYRDIERLIESKLKAERTTSANEYLYPSETYDTFFIYEKGGTMLKQAYVVDGGEVTFVNEPKPVTKDVEWTELNTNEDNSMRKLMLAGLEAKGISVNAEITDADLLVKYNETNAAAPAANTDEVPAWAKDLAANMADMKKEMSDMKKKEMTAEEEAKAKKAKALAGNSKIAALGFDEASLLAMNSATLDNLYAKNVGTITGNAFAGVGESKTEDEVF